MFSPEKKKGNVKKMDFDDFDGSDYEKRPDSRIQRTASKGKGHLSANESESDGDDTMSVRMKRASNIQKMRKRAGNLNYEENSDYSEDDDQISRIKKPKKERKKREKSGILKMDDRSGPEDDIEHTINL